MADAPIRGSEYRFVLGKARLRQHSKSRNGCLNCKHRKIKCQETLPSCLNCTRLSLPCEYPSKEQTATMNRVQATTASLSSPETAGPVATAVNGAIKSTSTKGPSPMVDSDHNWSILNMPWAGKVLETEAFSTFVHAYGTGHVLGRNVFLEHHVAMDSLSLVLSSTIRTLSLAHLSQLHQDSDLAYQARLSYEKTLYHLRHAIEQIASGRRLRCNVEVISAIMLIGHYDGAIVPSSHSKRQSLARWAPHYDGSLPSLELRLLRSRANRDHARLLAIGLVSEYGPAQSLARGHEGMASFWHGSRSSNSTSILEELLAIRKRISDWLCSQLSGTPSVPTSNVRDLDGDIEEHTFITVTSPLVPLQYCFANMQTGMLSVLAMLACCLCDLSILRMKYRSYTSDEEIQTLTTRDIEQDVWTMSMELCRSIHFLSSHETAGFRDTEFEVLCFLSRYFLTRGALKEKKRCDGCRSALHKRAHRLYSITNRVLNPLSQDVGAFEHYVDWPPV
ncbi:hypothetical protein KVT40_002441 [Elsinoe batatas]|uniref:Zn(2)-C6 fungal-type domain-containing protein n=1 Tax=Elsinoe batatas TaxID=2601811 RepID=A0A8K0L8D8_9PEZI|nr:hypothetical protein KVT40_002441 [Elsinoe batatas]